MKRRGVLVIACLLVLSAQLFINGCAAPAPGGTPVKIGIFGPMKFTSGEEAFAAAQIAANEINQAGGISVAGEKRPIQLIKSDSNEMISIPDAVTAAERLLTADKADFMMGGFRSEAALAVQDVSAKYKKINIQCGAAHHQLAQRVAENYDKYKHWFRVSPTNTIDSSKTVNAGVLMVAKEVGKAIGVPKVKFFLLGEKAAWVDPQFDFFNKNAASFGVEVVKELRVSPTASDLTAELASVKESGAQVIYTIFSGPVGVAFAKQWGELKIQAAPVGLNIEAGKKGFLEATGGFGNYITQCDRYGRVEITPKTIPFWDKMLAGPKLFPTFASATYDSIYILKEAIEKAGTVDSDALVPVLEQTDLVVPGGRCQFSPKGSPFPHDQKFGPGLVTHVHLQWQDGKYETIWPPADGSWEKTVYKGTTNYVVPPWVIAAWKGK